MSTGLRDLRVWQEAVSLAAELLQLRRRLYRRELALPLDALAGTALTVATEIAHGAGRYEPELQRPSYQAAREALLRLETLLAIARLSELLEPAACSRLSERCGLVGRLLGGYLVYLDRQASAGTPKVP
jgi:four helix bundle protein